MPDPVGELSDTALAVISAAVCGGLADAGIVAERVELVIVMPAKMNRVLLWVSAPVDSAVATSRQPTCRGCQFNCSDSSGGGTVWGLCEHPAWEVPGGEWADGARVQDAGGAWYAPNVPEWCPLPEPERPQ